MRAMTNGHDPTGTPCSANVQHPPLMLQIATSAAPADRATTIVMTVMLKGGALKPRGNTLHRRQERQFVSCIRRCAGKRSSALGAGCADAH